MIYNFSLIVLFFIYSTVTIIFTVDFIPNKMPFKCQVSLQKEIFRQQALSKDERTAIKIADSVIVAQMKNCPHKLTEEQRSLKSYDVTVSAFPKNSNSFEVNYKLKKDKSDGFIPAFTILVNIATRETEFKGMN